MVAIRIRNLARYFGPRVDIDGAERPGEAWRALLRVAGFNVKVVADDDIQRTVAIPGHVLKDVSLDIEHGSVVCLTGASGSGKSVLLKILAGVIPPTGGSVAIYGTVSSLLAIGDNLDEFLTAQENIERAALLAGASPEGIVRVTAEAIDFAGLQGFEQVPLRTYSTGMTMRLGVAIALSGFSSIVLIDDVLGVGDIAFQQKCIDRLHALKEAGSTLVLALSDETLIQQLATRVVTLGGGHVVADSPRRHWMRAQYASSAADVEWRTALNLPEDDVVVLRSVDVQALRNGDETYLELASTFETKTNDLRCWPLLIFMRDRLVVFRSLYSGFMTVDTAQSLTFRVNVPTHILSNGEYSITVSMVTLHGKLVYSLKAHDVVTLTIARSTGDAAPETGSNPMLAVSFPWKVEPIAEAGA